MKIKNPELIRKKQQQICRGALKVFKTKGFHAASIREIAEASQISLGSLYDYIEKKEDILFLVHQHGMDRISSRIQKWMDQYTDPYEQLVHVLKEIFLLSIDLKEELSFMYSETKHLPKTYLEQILRQDKEFVNFVESLIKKCVNSDAVQCRNPEIYANIVIFLAAIIPLRGWNLFPKHSHEEVIDELIRLTVSGLSPERRDREPVTG
jgi:AcrR family transcriptional regulator